MISNNVNSPDKITISVKQRDALKILSELPRLIEQIPANSLKKEFAIFSELSVLSNIEGLEDLEKLSEL